MTTVVTDRLTTDDKKKWLTEPNINAHREVVEGSGLLQDVDGVIDGQYATNHLVLLCMVCHVKPVHGTRNRITTQEIACKDELRRNHRSHSYEYCVL